ncbi:MAG: F0F1 ATP synthase subunit alpha [bacterium]|nr:F0F1 ATP synthase subunit alpha [bacterium]
MRGFKDYLQESGEIGYIQSIVHSIVYVSGLPGAKPREVVMAEGGQRGIIQSLLPDSVEVLMLETHDLKNNLAVTRTKQYFTIPVSEQILGRIVDPFGHPVDGLGPIPGEKKPMSIDPGAPPLHTRVKIDKPLETGVQTVDLMVPLGYGQRELVIGDKKTGKTIFLLQTIVNQASKGVICVYVSIGKRQSDVKAVEEYLKHWSGAFNNCTILVANSADPASMIYLSPFSGFAIAEFFREQGKDVLIIFDDLTNHAKFYREISLLSKRTPGRSSYPGDIFNLHASMLERAGNIKYGDKTVSITALPVAESFEGDITGYIQTNLMSITDGHIFFDVELFRNGARPSINHALSVSRVGNQTRGKLDKELAQKLREALAKYEKDKEIARFGVDLPQATKTEIDLGEKIELIFNQDTESLVPRELSLMLFGLLLGGFWAGKNVSSVKVDVIKITEKFQKGELNDFLTRLAKIDKIDDLLSTVKTFYDQVTEKLYE